MLSVENVISSCASLCAAPLHILTAWLRVDYRLQGEEGVRGNWDGNRARRLTSRGDDNCVKRLQIISLIFSCVTLLFYSVLTQKHSI